MAQAWIPAHEFAAPTGQAKPSRPKRLAPLAARGWRWLSARGLKSLGAAAIAAAAATVLFATAGLLRSVCDAACSGAVAVPAGVLGTLAWLAVLGGLAAVGNWIGHLTQRTWQERLLLEIAGLELGPAADGERLRRLRALSAPEGDLVQIHRRGRVSLWTGLPVAVASMLMLPVSASSFGDGTSDAPYLFPLVALALVAAAAATVRGWVLLRAARCLLGPAESHAAAASVSHTLRARPDSNRRPPA